MELIERIKGTLQSIHSIIAGQQAPDDGLFTGNLSLVIYYFCIGKHLDPASCQAKAAFMIENIMERLENAQSSLQTCLYSTGLSGLGWVIQFLIDHGEIDFDLENDFRVIDEFIYETALDFLAKGNVEYLHGGTGALYYFHSRHEESKLLHYQEQLVDGILEQIGKDPMNVRIPRSKFPWNKNDDYDLSLSHGLCGVLLVLLSVLETGKLQNINAIRQYLERAAAYISRLRRPTNDKEGKFCILPDYMEKNMREEAVIGKESWANSRLAWCYGDLGWALFFYRYGLHINEDRYIMLADDIGYATTLRKKVDETNSSTSHFCHGHSGLAYMYRALHRISGRREYLEASEFWAVKALETLDIELANDFYKDKSLKFNFLEGLTGISLALSAFLESEDPGWGKFLLL